MAKHKNNFVITENRITNIVCPYGYSFCYEKKRAKDERYMQEWTCNWFCDSKGPAGMFCIEIASSGD